MIKIVKKGTASSFGGGRGRDNTAMGASYIVEKDGQALGSILPNSRRCFEAAEWEVYEYIKDASGKVTGYKPLKRYNSMFDEKPFKKAKEFAMEYFTA